MRGAVFGGWPRLSCVVAAGPTDLQESPVSSDGMQRKCTLFQVNARRYNYTIGYRLQNRHLILVESSSRRGVCLVVLPVQGP